MNPLMFPATLLASILALAVSTAAAAQVDPAGFQFFSSGTGTYSLTLSPGACYHRPPGLWGWALSRVATVEGLVIPPLPATKRRASAA